MNEELKVIPHIGSRGVRVVGIEHPVPYEFTEEGLEAAAMRVPSGTSDPAKLDAAADGVIAEITGK